MFLGFLYTVQLVMHFFWKYLGLGLALGWHCCL